MTASVDHILKVLRTHLPNNLAISIKEESLSKIIPGLLNPLFRELCDSVTTNRKLLSQAPTFPCTLQFTSSSSNNNSSNNTIEGPQVSVGLWNAVLPWETAMGLSHVDLNSYDCNNNNNSNTHNNELKKLPTGMLFASQGLINATSDLKGGFAPMTHYLSFWSGAIRQPIDVLFLQGKRPIRVEATYARRQRGALAKELVGGLDAKDANAPTKNKFWCLNKDVQKLDPLPQFLNDVAEQEEPKAKKNSSSSTTFLDLFYDSSSHESKSFSVQCPVHKNAPMLVLELPENFIKNHVVPSNVATENISKKQSYVELRLGQEICDDIDHKMMIATNFLPVLQEATNLTLKRLCGEVLQKGAKHIREARSNNRDPGNKKILLNEMLYQKSTWTVDDTEFLILASKLGLADYEMLGTTWDVLADAIDRDDRYLEAKEDANQKGGGGSIVFEQNSSSSDNNNNDEEEDDNNNGIDHREISFNMIRELIQDGSVPIPHSIKGILQDK